MPSATKNEITPSILLQINWKDSKFWINPRDSTRLRPLPLKTDDRLNVMFWRPRGNSRLVLPPIVPSMWPVRRGSSWSLLSVQNCHISSCCYAALFAMSRCITLCIHILVCFTSDLQCMNVLMFWCENGKITETTNNESRRHTHSWLHVHAFYVDHGYYSYLELK